MISFPACNPAARDSCLRVSGGQWPAHDVSKSSDQDFDLELHFLPAWAQKPSQETSYGDYRGPAESRGGDDQRRERRRDRGPGGPRPQRRPGDRPRPGGPGGAQRPPDSAEARGPRREQRGGPDRGDRGTERRPAPARAHLPDVQVEYKPLEQRLYL